MFLSIELEIEANKLVREYLSFADYPSTLSSFDVECGLKGRGPAPAAEEGDAGAPNRDDERARTIEEMQNRFQLAFQDGNRDEFFGLWDANFPVELRQSDPMYQKMEFQLNIYFAVFPIHPFVSERAAKQYAVPATMEAFKVFLATRGADLCKTTQFLNYYALPYVPDPRVHPSFTDLFTERHIRDLQERLRGFLASALRAADAPFLLKLLTGHSGAHSRADKEAKDHLLEMKAMRQRVRDLEDSENVQSSKFRLFQNDYHNLISIASELVQTLAACINGERITTSYLTGVCQRLAAFKGSRKSSPSKVLTDLPNGNNEKPPSGTQSPLKSPMKQSTPLRPQATPLSPIKSAKSRSQTPEVNRGLEGTDADAVVDYDRLRRDLSAVTTSEKEGRSVALLVQAVRLRFMHPPDGRHPRDALKDMIRKDFLSVGTLQVARPLLLTGSPVVKEQAAMLLSSIASECCGREYLLSQGDMLVRTMIEALKSESEETALRQHLLGVLQKLSLRRAAQSFMNRLHVIPHLIGLLEKYDALTDRTLDNVVALLMNLCLRTSGRAECRHDPERALNVLADLVESDASVQVLTYVNGILYSLFGDPTLRDCAADLGLREVLEERMKVEEEPLRGQIAYVIERMDSANDEDSSDTLSVDGEEEDMDDEEDEGPEDEPDPLEPLPGIPANITDAAGKQSEKLAAFALDR